MSSPLSLQRWILLRSSSSSSTSLVLLRHNQQQFHYSTTAAAMMVRRVSSTQQQRQQQQRHSLFLSLPSSSRACWLTTSTRDHPVNQRVRDMKTKTKSKYGAGADEEEEVEGSQIVASSSSSEGPSTLIKRFREEGDTGLTREPIPLHAVRENDLDEHEAMFGESLRPSATNDDPCPEWQNPLHHNNPDMQRFFPEDFPGGEIPPEAYVPAPPVKDVDGSGIYAPQNVVEICNDMLQLNMLEMAALHQKICLHFGFPYDDPISGGGGMGGGGNAAAAAAPEPEAAAPAKTVFDLKLVGYDEKSKIKVIKEVRAAIPGLGLKEAKELVEGAPKVISKDMKPELAEELKKKLEDAGAIIEIV